MAHFAKIGLNNYVLQINVVADSDCLDNRGNHSEQVGIDFQFKITGYPFWKQCSYNTSENVHRLGGTPFRKNYPLIGWKWDEERDAFIQPRIYASWIFNEDKGIYEPPTPMPSGLDDNNKNWVWNEDTKTWDEFGEA